MNLILNIDKPYGWTSADVVRKLKNVLRKAGMKKEKIGHAGTLDPLATGVLIICVGRDATKQIDSIQNGHKKYVFTVELGATTPSFDLEHPIDATYPWEHITDSDIHAFAASLQGEIDQIPPLFSAKKVDGKRAYNLARAGVDAELKPARITIYSAQILDISMPRVKMEIECSRGTYIRSIARDMGADLDSGGYLSELRRTSSGNYTAEESVSVERAVEILLEEIEKQKNITNETI